MNVLRMYALRNIAVAKRAVRKTKADAVLDRNENPLAATVLKALRHQATAIARQLSHGYAQHVKAEQPAWIEDLVDNVDTDGVGIAVRDALTDYTREVFRKAGLTALAEVDVDASGEMLQHMDTLALAFAKQRGADLVTSISETTRGMLRDLVGDGVEQGWSAQTLASEIESSAAFDQARSLLIARTELAFSHTAGNLAGYRASGEVERKSWLASDGACPICVELDGDEVDLDDTFDVDGDELDGPPAHPNCRCDVLPVLKEE